MSNTDTKEKQRKECISKLTPNNFFPVVLIFFVRFFVC